MTVFGKPSHQKRGEARHPRQLFFPAADVGTWSDLAATDPDPFADEKERAAAKKKKRPPQA
ncbi:hypothetical protein ACWGTI_04210 [Mesorhizobium sp. ArgA1]